MLYDKSHEVPKVKPKENNSFRPLKFVHKTQQQKSNREANLKRTPDNHGFFKICKRCR